MRQTKTSTTSNSATGLPTKYLPDVEFRDLPEPVSLRRVLGPGVIVSATALGAGEFILWPYITVQLGLSLMWVMALTFVLSYFLFTEVARYTLATGETAVTGFTRMWKPWGLVMVIAAIVTNMWPGWATGFASLLTASVGLDQGQIPAVAVGGLVVMGVALSVSPVVYKTVEKIQMAVIIFSAAFVFLAIVLVTGLGDWTHVLSDAPSGVTDFPTHVDRLGLATLVGAIIFVGTVGTNMLVVSNYVRDKGMGMGRHIPRIVSPLTGKDEAPPSLGYMVEPGPENLRRWNGWWKVAKQEQLYVYCIFGVVTTVSLCVLAYATLGIVEAPGEQLEFIQDEAAYLNDTIGPWFRVFFLAAGCALLVSTNLGVLDLVARLAADSVKITLLSQSRFWTESRLYLIVVWLMIVTGSTIILVGFTQPVTLLITTGVGQAFVTVLLCVLLMVLNRRALPAGIRIERPRMLALTAALAFFGIFTALLAIGYFQ